jgi:DNA-binding NarL/FixJ family response regulator
VNTASAGGGIDVLVVDDHEMIAESLAVGLAQLGCNVVGTATSRAAALSHLNDGSVHVVITELTDVDRLIPAILERSPDTKVLILTTRSDDWSLSTAVDAGCHGYILKDQTLDELREAVETVARGEAAFAPTVLSRVLRLLRPGAGTELLTARETDVLRRLADGLTTEQIASDLYLSVNTVRNHVNSIIRKLNVHSRLEAVSAAIRRGLIRVG